MKKSELSNDAPPISAEKQKFLDESKAQQNKSPLHKLLYIMGVCDPATQQFLQLEVAEIVQVELKKFIQVRKGIELDPTGTDSVERMFGQTIKFMQSECKLDHHVDATVLDSMTNIAVVIDKGVKRVLLGEKLKNKAAYLDILSMHAKMTAALAHLMQAPDVEPLDGDGHGNSN